MSAINDLKEIINSQKTIRTSRLDKYVKEIEAMYIQQAKKIRKQRINLDILNKKVNRLSTVSYTHLTLPTMAVV